MLSQFFNKLLDLKSADFYYFVFFDLQCKYRIGFVFYSKETNINSRFGRVRYLLDFSFDSDPTAAAATFMIDQYTGAVYLIRPFNYETKSLYTLYMNVTDNYTQGIIFNLHFQAHIQHCNGF